MKLEEWPGHEAGGFEVAQAWLAETPLSGTGNGAGRLYYRKAVGLTLAGGNGTLFGCTWDGCGFWADNATSIVSGHWKVHEMKPDLRRVPFGQLPLNEILGKLSVAEAELASVHAAREADAAVIRDLRSQVKRLEKELSIIRNGLKAAFPGGVK